MKTMQNCRRWTNLGSALTIALLWFVTKGATLAAAADSTPPPAPSGSFQYDIRTNGGPALWNFGGSYLVPFYSKDFYGFTPNHSQQWRHDARGLIAALDDDDSAAKLAGTSRSAGSTVKVRLSGAWSGRKEKLSLTFDPSTRTFNGTDRVSETSVQLVMDCPNSFWECDHWKYARTTSSTVQPIAFAAPETTDGDWALNLEIVPAGNKLSGTGSITFSNGEAFQFQLIGSYSPKTQKTKVVLKGIGDDKGATLMLSLAGAEMTIESMRGIVSGQRIRFP